MIFVALLFEPIAFRKLISCAKKTLRRLFLEHSVED